MQAKWNQYQNHEKGRTGKFETSKYKDFAILERVASIAT